MTYEEARFLSPAQQRRVHAFVRRGWKIAFFGRVSYSVYVMRLDGVVAAISRDGTWEVIV